MPHASAEVQGRSKVSFQMNQQRNVITIRAKWSENKARARNQYYAYDQ